MDVGTVLAERYELLELLGAGGMGRVFRAHDRRLDRTVAVKVLAPHLTGDARAVERLREEARLAAAVQHPNVVGVLDALLDGDAPAIVLEHVDGPALADVVPAAGMADLDDALGVVVAVGAGLAAAHAVGLVHRDVTPRNVLLDDGEPRLTDFGIARAVDADPTATTTVRASVGYLAPEQASGGEVGPAADVYALACLATTVLTGSPPYAAEDPVGVVHQHLHAEPPDLRERRATVPPEVAAAVRAGLSKRPEERPPTVAAFCAALGGPGRAAVADRTAVLPATVAAAATTTVVDAAPTTPAGPAGGDAPVRGGRVVPFVAGLVVAGLAAAAFGLLGTGDPGTLAVDATPSAAPTPEPSPTSTPTPTAEPTPTPTADPTPTTAAEAVAALRATLVDQRAAGALDPGAVSQLDRRLTEAADRLRRGDVEDAAKKLREFRDKLAEFAEKERVELGAEEQLLRGVLLAEELLPVDDDG